MLQNLNGLFILIKAIKIQAQFQSLLQIKQTFIPIAQIAITSRYILQSLLDKRRARRPSKYITRAFNNTLEIIQCFLIQLMLEINNSLIRIIKRKFYTLLFRKTMFFNNNLHILIPNFRLFQFILPQQIRNHVLQNINFYQQISHLIFSIKII